MGFDVIAPALTRVRSFEQSLLGDGSIIARCEGPLSGTGYDGCGSTAARRSSRMQTVAATSAIRERLGLTSASVPAAPFKRH